MTCTIHYLPDRVLPETGVRERSPVFDPYQIDTLAPEEPLYVIGDVHGCLDLLERVLERVWKLRERSGGRIILVGDYVDRGPASAGVLSLLADLAAGNAPPTCLKGNHEIMMMEFLREPTRAIDWLMHGGRATLRSYGLDPLHPFYATKADLDRLAEKLADAIPPRVHSFLRDLKLSTRSGNIFVSHAGADPMVPLHRQSPDTLTWGHRSRATPRPDGSWVIQGHLAGRRPALSARHLIVDTGASDTGCLTTAVLQPGKIEFVSVRA
ncbi:metallophosphoesterase [Algicella marina]|nr:metallophosphoesterase [Algicella marina]